MCGKGQDSRMASEQAGLPVNHRHRGGFQTVLPLSEEFPVLLGIAVVCPMSDTERTVIHF